MYIYIIIYIYIYSRYSDSGDFWSRTVRLTVSETFGQIFWIEKPSNLSVGSDRVGVPEKSSSLPTFC